MVNNIQIEVPGDVRAVATEAMSVVESKVRNLVTKDPDFFPMFTEKGKWRHGKEAWTNWCEGFLAGQMWILAKHHDSRFWRSKAEHYSKHLEDRKFDTKVHDLGFTFWHSWRTWYLATSDPAINEVLIRAGRTMGLRFNEKAGFLRSFLAEDSTFIDIMMNVGIVFYAAIESNDSELLAKAHTHTMQTRRHLIRGDGSAAHEGIFDLNTGEFLRQTTQQGWRNDSSWARGQTWALYGFGTCYALTGEEKYLETAQACADFYIERTGHDFVPPNDWEERNPLQRYESSAGAIAASGLMQLSKLVRDESKAKLYANYAFEIVRKLCTSEFLASKTEDWEGALKHGSYHETKKLGVDESVMWGEYFFTEALDKVLGGDWLATNR